MTCMAAPNNELVFFPNERFSVGWGRKHTLDDFSSDEEAHSAMQERQTIDRLKEFNDHNNVRNTLLNTEAYKYSDEPMTPNSRKRLFSEHNASPDFRTHDSHPEDGRHRLTLSQVATQASEQEPLSYPDDEDVEEILMRLRHGHDYYRPQVVPSLPSILFTPPPSHMSCPPFYSLDNTSRLHPVAPSPNKASIYHILSQDHPDNVNSMSSHHQHHHMSVNNHHNMRKMYFEDVLDGDELGLEHPKKKARKEAKPRSPLKSIIVNNDDVQEKETVAAGLCFKTHKPKVQREYYYAKLSKTIFRWTCCGSQAKTHPDA